MTDNESIKAFEWVVNCNGRNVVDCIGCPLAEFYPCCKEKALEFALDLIARQKAEIERLNFVRTRDQMRYEEKLSAKAETNCALFDLHSAAIKEVKELEVKLKTAKAEAYKEFAERLCEDRVSNDPVVIAAKCLLKEKVGDNDAKI